MYSGRIPSSRHLRPGFTILEILVVVSVIGVIFSLLMPAVQSAREAARRTQCRTNLKQIATAWLIHENTHRHFPTGGWGWLWAGDPNAGYGVDQTGGWGYNILPFIGQANMHDYGKEQGNAAATGARRITEPLSLYYCPSRRSVQLYATDFQMHHCDPTPLIARTDYAANAGDQEENEFYEGPETKAEGLDPDYNWPATENLSGVSFQRSTIKTQRIQDGLSNTYMIGEKYLNPDNYETGKDGSDNENAFTGFNNDVYRVTFNPPHQDRSGLVDQQSFGSAHAGCFSMALCDGSVKSISYNIEPETFRSMGNRDNLRFPADR